MQGASPVMNRRVKVQGLSSAASHMSENENGAGPAGGGRSHSQK